MKSELILLLAAACLFGYLVLRRANELFCLSVRTGRVLLVRGAIPAALLHDIKEVVRLSRMQSGTIRAVRSDGRAQIMCHGGSAEAAQRIRNVFSIHPLQKLRAAPMPKARNLGQILGIASLAWLLLGRHHPDA